MFRKTGLVILIVFLFGCNLDDEVFAANQSTAISEGKKIWAFIQYNLPQEDGKLEDYYYFGLINEVLYKKMISHEVKNGLIKMESVRYWDNDDVIQSIEDEIYSDELVFQIEDIRKIDLVKNEPVIGFKYPDKNQDSD